MSALDRIEALLDMQPPPEDPRLEEAKQQVAAALKGRVAEGVEKSIVDARYAHVAKPSPLSATGRMIARGTPTRIPVSRRAYR